MKAETKDSFLESLMILPKKPDFVGYTIETALLYEQMVQKLNEIMGMDLSAHCSQDAAEDGEFYFYIDEYSIESEMEDGDAVLAAMPFDYEAPWETTQYLLSKMYDLENTWAYAQVRYHDPSVCELHIGIPRDL